MDRLGSCAGIKLRLNNYGANTAKSLEVWNNENCVLWNSKRELCKIGENINVVVKFMSDGKNLYQE
jgi:hypothetical protein